MALGAEGLAGPSVDCDGGVVAVSVAGQVAAPIDPILSQEETPKLLALG